MVPMDVVLCASDSTPAPHRIFSMLARAFLLILTIMPTMNVAGDERPYQISYILPGTCCTYDGLIQCSSKLEKHALSSGEFAVSRNNERLCLPILQQNAKCFTDRKDLHYAFAGVFINKYYLVLEILDESWELLMVSKDDGRETRLPSYPVPNPSRTSFATASFDIDAGYTPNIIQIWNIPAQEEPLLEISKFPVNQGPAAITWRSDTELHADLDSLESETGSRMIVKETSSGWSAHVIKVTEKQGDQKTTH